MAEQLIDRSWEAFQEDEDFVVPDDFEENREIPTSSDALEKYQMKTTPSEDLSDHGLESENLPVQPRGKRGRPRKNPISEWKIMKKNMYTQFVMLYVHILLYTYK